MPSLNGTSKRSPHVLPNSSFTPEHIHSDCHAIFPTWTPTRVTMHAYLAHLHIGCLHSQHIKHRFTYVSFVQLGHAPCVHVTQPRCHLHTRRTPHLQTQTSSFTRCPTWVSRLSALHERPTRVARHSALYECPTQVAHHLALHEHPTRVAHRSAFHECPTRVAHRSALHECPTWSARHSALHKRPVQFTHCAGTSAQPTPSHFFTLHLAHPSDLCPR